MAKVCEAECYELLRTEIVKSAVNDLKKAMRKSDRVGFVCDEQKALEKWFLSRWGEMLSGGNGEFIIEKCRQSYKCAPKQNRQKQLPVDLQKKIYAEWKNKVVATDIYAKYGITKCQLYTIVRRWRT